MSKKHFVPPIIEQWIEKLGDKSNSTFVKENYANYLDETRRAIDLALIKYNLEKR